MKRSDPVRVVLADRTDLREMCFALRETVFIGEQNVPPDLERDAEDSTAQHVLALQGECPVGAARYVEREGYAKLQRICVLKEVRGMGVGAALTEFMIAQIRDAGHVQQVRLSSQEHAIPFYERLGFEATGPRYMEAGIPHRDMVLRLG